MDCFPITPPSWDSWNMLPRIVTCSALLSLFLAIPSHAGPDPKGIGQKIGAFRLERTGDAPFSLQEVKGKKAVVVVFLSFDCPVSNSYIAALTELAGSYRDKGVAVIGICPATDAQAVDRSAKDYKPGFPVYADEKLAAADAFRAETTPEVFLLDAEFVLRYRGRINDAYAARLKPNKQVSSHDLVNALDALLAGKPISQAITPTVGCPIRRPEAVKKATTSVTYYKDVVPILQERCQSCHRPGEVGPFSLLTYRQAVNWADDIKEYTRSRAMPPWKPTAGVKFIGERKVTDKEIDTLAAWVDGGTPAGDPREAPPPRKFPEGWLLGKPDLVLAPKEEMIVGPTGSDLFRCFVFPTNQTEDKFVVAYEVRPGNRRVVHHTFHFLDTKGRGRRLEERAQERERRSPGQDRGPGYTMMMAPGFFPPDGDLGGWAPGLLPGYLPEGVGYYLPKGSDLIVQLHYHRNGKEERDRTQVGLYFAKKSNVKPVQVVVVPGAFFGVPPGRENHPVQGSVWVAQDCTIHSVTPHMHLIGKKIKMSVTPPGGKTTTLLNIDQWDFNWQETYFLEKPMRVPAGTRFDVEAVYDNSSKNPNNPNNPPRFVLVGEQTTNEMCLGFVEVTGDEPGAVGFRLLEKGLLIYPPRLLPPMNVRK
jgi:peroxiredoxin